MKTYKVYLSYVKDFTVEANSYEEAIKKAHEGDVVSEGSLTALNTIIENLMLKNSY